MDKFFITGPYSYGYIITAENKETAIEKILDLEETLYDSWASDPDDWWPRKCDFESVTEEKFRQEEWEYYDLDNYDWTKCHWGSNDFPPIVEIEHK